MRRAAVLLAGCGRLGFDAAPEAGRDDASVSLTDAPTADAPTNAITWRFGERLGLEHTNVTVDTFISNEAGEQLLNYGGTDVLRSEADVDERILVRFDLEAIPANAQVIGAQVTVGITQLGPGAVLTVHPLHELWTEGTLDGAPGNANYMMRTATDAWTTIGAGTPGSAGAAMGSGMPLAIGDLAIELDPSVVQGWVSSPAANFGVIFFNSSVDSVRFAASEHSESSIRPMLRVTFVP